MYTVDMAETHINVSSVNINMNEQFTLDYWAKSGFAQIRLTQSGLANNAKVCAKYAHTYLGGAPSISVSGSNVGVGFSFSGQVDVFESNVLGSQTASTIN